MGRGVAGRGIRRLRDLLQPLLGPRASHSLRQALPITEEVSRTTMFLPIYPSMTEMELQYVVDNLKELLTRRER